jgi:glutathione S-transferase
MDSELSKKVIANLLDQVDELKPPAFEGSVGKFSYFPLYAKGLQPTLILAVSGVEWEGNPVGFDAWGPMKASGVCPFGQLPILQTPSGSVLGQATAICNFVAKVGGIEGKDANEFAVSQMCMAEGEDLYATMQKNQDTMFVKDKLSAEDLEKFWGTTVPEHFGKLEALVDKSGFTNSGTTGGELYLFGMIYQMTKCRDGILAAFPKLSGWFDKVSAHPKVAMVLAGKSQMGELGQYFLKK